MEFVQTKKKKQTSVVGLFLFELDFISFFFFCIIFIIRSQCSALFRHFGAFQWSLLSFKLVKPGVHRQSCEFIFFFVLSCLKIGFVAKKTFGDKN